MWTTVLHQLSELPRTLSSVRSHANVVILRGPHEGHRVHRARRHLYNSKDTKTSKRSAQPAGVVLTAETRDEARLSTGRIELVQVLVQVLVGD